jgi:hypothetical protein
MIKRRRFKQSETLEQRLGLHAIRLREEAKLFPLGVKRDQLLRLARQAEIGAHMSERLVPQAYSLRDER